MSPSQATGIEGEITVQVNLSAGDAAYAAATVPALVQAHPQAVARLAVVDLCRPQRTRIFDPAKRLPEPGFSTRAAAIWEMAMEWQRAGLFDTVVKLEPGSPLISELARRYTRPWMTETHDYGGCAGTAYWAALALPATRFVAHYDADMLLYQAPGFDWAEEAVRHWSSFPGTTIAATPRPSPPGFAASPGQDGAVRQEGRPTERIPLGWLNDWFSTRCFLVDRERLAPNLPLIHSRDAWRWRLRRLVDRGYPPSPEVVLCRSLGRQGWRRLALADERAWLLHPHSKPPGYLALLPKIQAAVAAGLAPDGQKGFAEIQLAAWQAFFR